MNTKYFLQIVMITIINEQKIFMITIINEQKIFFTNSYDNNNK